MEYDSHWCELGYERDAARSDLVTQEILRGEAQLMVKKLKSILKRIIIDKDFTALEEAIELLNKGE